MSDKQIIDAEFQVAERRLPPIRWGSVLRWIFWAGAMSFSVYHLQEPWERVAVVLVCLFWLAIGPLFGLLAAPRLQSQEVEQLAARLRANARPGRERR